MLDLLAFKATDVPAENLIENGNFSKGTSGWSAGTNIVDFRVEGGVARFTGQGGTTSMDWVYANPITELNVKYFIALEIKTNNVGNVYVLSENITPSVIEEFQYKSLVYEATFATRVAYFRANQGVSVEVDNVIAINLTKTFGKGNEPTAKQMDALLEQFPSSWFDGTKNLFNAKHFMNTYHKKITELENAITTLGGSV